MLPAAQPATASACFSVIICAYTEERWEDLIAAVESVRQQTLPPLEIIVVCDHNPTLFALARERFAGAVVIENSQPRGLSGARNSGIAASNGKVLAFLDDDAVAAPDWLSALAAHYQDPAVMGAGGQIQPMWLAGRPGWFPAEFEWVVGCTYLGMPTRIAPVRNLIGANMSFRRQVFVDVGDFRSGMGRVGAFPAGCEETELCIRANQRWPEQHLVYDPAAVVQHRVPASRGAWAYFSSRCYAEGLSKALVSRMVGAGDGLSTERQYTLRILPRGILSGISSALHGKWTGLGQAAAIALGAAITGFGYLVGRIKGLTALSSSPKPERSAEKELLSTPPRPMRVLMATPRFLPFTGGVENHVYQVARRMVSEGVEVTVLTTDPSRQLPASECIDGIHVERLPAYPAKGDYYFSPRIYAFIRGGMWDLVHIQSYHTLVPPLAMLAALRSGIPYVVTFHGGGHSSRLRNLIRRAQRLALRPLLARAERLVALAHFEIEQYSRELRLPDSRFVTIPNGCDLPAEKPSTAPHSAGSPVPGGTLIISVGRLERYKGHQRLIAALPEILRQKPDARVWIVGSGRYENELRALAARLGVQDRVLIGAIPPAERGAMAEALSGARLFVLLSEFETHPIAVLEALSLGVPALVAHTSGLAELAEQGYAHSIPLNSTSHQVAEAVIRQLNHPLVPEVKPLPTWKDCTNSLLIMYHNIVVSKAKYADINAHSILLAHPGRN